MKYIVIILILILSIILFCSLRVMLAKSTAIRRRKNELSIFWGLVKLILWEANEGLVLLKDKRITEIIYGLKDGGGTRFIYPIFGEELRVRVPLTLKLTQFKDSNVLTRESIRLFMKVALWWKVANLESYYYLIDKQVHIMDDQYRHQEILEVPADARQAQQDAAEDWILTLAESCIRKLVSQSTTALVVSKNASSYMHIDNRGDPLSRGPSHSQSSTEARSKAAVPVAAPYMATPDTLADEIHQMLEPKVAEYGLEIDRVEVQEVRLPKELQEALDRLFRAHLQPAQSQQEARAKQIELQAVADVLGVQTVSLTEVMKQFRGSTYVGGFPRFIEALFAKTAASLPNDTPPLPIAKGEEVAGALPHQANPEASNFTKEVKSRCPKCRSAVTVSMDNQKDDQIVECPSCGATFRLQRKGSGR